MRSAITISLYPTPLLSLQVMYGSSALIQAATMPMWVHCSDDFAYSTGKRGAQESEVIVLGHFVPFRSDSH